MHRIMVDQGIPGPNERMTISGEEAEHAVRVKRIAIGEQVGLMDGAGVIATASVTAASRGGGRRSGPQLELLIGARREVAYPGATPIVEVMTAVPKGSRVDELVEQLSQVGAASWSPLQAERGVVEPRDAKLARLERIARESAKQCGRAWVMRIGPRVGFAGALGAQGRMRIIVADATGVEWAVAGSPPPGVVRLLVGPEGGWTNEELAAARAAGAEVIRFGPHVMRIETAAVAACAVVMAGG